MCILYNLVRDVASVPAVIAIPTFPIYHPLLPFGLLGFAVIFGLFGGVASLVNVFVVAQSDLFPFASSVQA